MIVKEFFKIVANKSKITGIVHRIVSVVLKFSLIYSVRSPSNQECASCYGSGLIIYSYDIAPLHLFLEIAVVCSK